MVHVPSPSRKRNGGVAGWCRGSGQRPGIRRSRMNTQERIFLTPCSEIQAFPEGNTVVATKYDGLNLAGFTFKSGLFSLDLCFFHKCFLGFGCFF